MEWHDRDDRLAGDRLLQFHMAAFLARLMESEIPDQDGNDVCTRIRLRHMDGIRPGPPASSVTELARDLLFHPRLVFQKQLNGLFEILSRVIDRLALAYHAQLYGPRHVPFTLFDDTGREFVGHSIEKSVP